MNFPGFLTDPRNKINETEMSIELHNGSTIFFAGLDSNNITRIMGDKFATIWLNECDEFEYDDVMKLKSRLRDVRTTIYGKPLALRMFYDLNPNTKDHFSYQCFILKQNPAKNVPLRDPDDWDSLQMNVSETDTHLGPDYLNDQKDGSDAHVQRYVAGYWRDEREYSMFRPSDVNAARVTSPPDLKRIVVAIDPNASDNPGSDETGIIVAGVDFGEGDDAQFYVLADVSTKGSPSTWAKAAVAAYEDHSADCIVAEKNNGGSMISEVLRHNGAANLPVKLVWASRGKVMRAEPVSALYAKGRVHHVGEHVDLERQMYPFHMDWNRSKDGSPDRLDALVWALTELSGKSAPPITGKVKKNKGFW